MSELQEILRRRLRRTEPDKFGEHTSASDIDRRIQEAKKASGAAARDPLPRALPRAAASLRDALIDGETEEEVGFRSKCYRGGSPRDVSSLADMEQVVAQERREQGGEGHAPEPSLHGGRATRASPSHDGAQETTQPHHDEEGGAPAARADEAAANGPPSGEEDLRDIREFLAQGDEELAFLSDTHTTETAGDGDGGDGAEHPQQAAEPAASSAAAPAATTPHVGTADLDARAVAGDAGMTEEQLAAAAAGLFGDRDASGDGSSDGEAEAEEEEKEEEDVEGGGRGEEVEGTGGEEEEEEVEERNHRTGSGRMSRHSRDASCLSAETHPLAALAGELVASSTASAAASEEGGADTHVTAAAAAAGGWGDTSEAGYTGDAARVKQLQQQVAMQRALLLQRDRELTSLRSQLAQALRSIAEADAVVARLLSERGGDNGDGIPTSPGAAFNPEESEGEEEEEEEDADAPSGATGQHRHTLASEVSSALSSFLDRTASLSTSLLGRRRQDRGGEGTSSTGSPASAGEGTGRAGASQGAHGCKTTPASAKGDSVPAAGERRSRFRGLVAEGSGPNLRTLSSHTSGRGGSSRSGRRQHRRRRGSAEGRAPRHAALGHWARHGAALGAGASAQLRRRRQRGHRSAGNASGDAASDASEGEGPEAGGEVTVPELAAPTAAAASGRVQRVFGPSPSPLVSTSEWLSACVELQVMGFAPERVREALRCVVEDREDAERVRQVAAAAARAEPPRGGGGGEEGPTSGSGGGNSNTEAGGAGSIAPASSGNTSAGVPRPVPNAPALATPAEGDMMTRRELLRPAVEVLLSLSLAAGDDKVTPEVVEALEDGSGGGGGGGGGPDAQGHRPAAGGEEEPEQGGDRVRTAYSPLAETPADETAPRGGRPRTAADHGLLDASDDDGGAEEGKEGEEEEVGGGASGAAASPVTGSETPDGAAAAQGRRGQRVRTSLFAGIRSEVGPSDASEEAAALAADAQLSRRVETREERAKREYNEFLDTLRRPECRDLVEDVGHFLVSVLHSQEGEGEAEAEGEGSRREAAQSLPVRTRNFLEAINRKAAQHPVWREEGEEGMRRVREGFEQYVMGKLHAMAFSNTRELRRRDEALLRRMWLLQFVTMDHLELPDGARNEMALSLAQAELRRINSFRTPREKLDCVVNASQMVFNVLSLARDKAGARPGADDFLPVFIYVVLKAQVPRLPSNVKYIEQYRDPTDMMSRGGYCFVNLQSAAEFIMTLGPESLKIDRSEFERLYREREEAMLRAECAEAARSGPFAE